MNVIIRVGKSVTLIFWGAVVISLFSVFPRQVGIILGWAGVAVFLLHTIELALFVRRFGDRLTEPKFDKLNVLVFGVFHLLPFLFKELERGHREGVSDDG